LALCPDGDSEQAECGVNSAWSHRSGRTFMLAYTYPLLTIFVDVIVA
jgi:hypothetical protein